MVNVRPEGELPPELHYSAPEVERYAASTRIQNVQRDLAARCVELLELDCTCEKERPLLLDVGCGNGYSSEVLAESGCDWIGVDVSFPMLRRCREQFAGELCDVMQGDIGEWLPFRPGVFDGAVSVSVVQWLAYSFSSDQDPKRRIRVFFDWLYGSLASGARAVLQFYAANDQQIDAIGRGAAQAGFGTHFVVDNPDKKCGRKVYLVLTTSASLGDNSMIARAIASASHAQPTRAVKKKEKISHREWIAKKKETMRRRGKEVKSDSKYSGRKRRDKF